MTATAFVDIQDLGTGKARVHIKIADGVWRSQVMDLPAARALRTALAVQGYDVQIKWS